MDKEKLNNPSIPEAEAPEEPVDEPVKEESLDEPIEEPTKGPNETTVDKEPIENDPLEDPVAVKPEPIEDDAVEAETPASEEKLSGEPTEPTGPLNQDLIASAEAEAPAEQAPVFQADTNQKSKSKSPLIFAIVALLVLALGGTGVWYFLLRDNGKTQPIAEDQHTVEPIDNTQVGKISGNELSDFDLSFLRLENNQDNLIYSPLSIKYALAMLSDASAGETKEQIDAVIGDYTPKAYLNSENRSLANGMFVRNDFAQNVKSTYTDTLQNKYYAEVIYDPFTSPDNANQWVEDKTLGIIKNTFDEATVNTDLDYMLVNALAIDMKWKNQLQCAKAQEYVNGEWVDKGGVPCINYGRIKFKHEKYQDYIHDAQTYGFAKHTFNGNENTETAEVAATYNKYDIIKELGEDSIRETVQKEYNNWLDDVNNNPEAHQCANTETAFNLDEYIEALSENYGKNSISSDYYFNVTENEKVFAKDLQEYDGSTLQYIGIMPTDSPLNNYVKTLTAEKVNNLISNLKDVAIAENFKEGVITKLKGYVPFFKFNFTMDKFMNHLQSLGITDVFSTADADLSGMLNFDKNIANKPYISIAIHKADIDFSNDGIKAAAVTAFGGMGAGCIEYFDYEWDVPVEEIDLTFDQPFLCLIRDKNTGEVWFAGTVYNPGE